MNWGQMLKQLLVGYPPPPEMISKDYPAFLQKAGGLSLTLMVTLLALIVGGILGIVLALGRRALDKKQKHKVWRGLAASGRAGLIALIEGIRGLPIVLIVWLTFYLPYPLLGLRLPSFLLATLAFTFYTAAYLAEIIRAGFRSVGPGLRDAGQTLGMSRAQIFRRIELPLVIRTMRPDLINLAITVFKDSSTLATVGVAEITYISRQAMLADPQYYAQVLGLVLLAYWVPATLLSALAFRLEGNRMKLEKL